MEKQNEKKNVPKSAKKRLEKVEVPPVSENPSAEETELRKKLRNKNKKLDGIKELDAKIKNGDVVPDEGQKAKVEGKRALITEIQELEHEIVNLLKKELAEKVK